jgi:hypothetical protein
LNVIGKPKLFEAARATRNPRVVEKNDFGDFVELQRVPPSVDLVGDKLVFNLGSHRLFCGVSFQRKAFFKSLLSRSAYDQGGWKS